MYNIGKGIATVGIWAAVAYITGQGGDVNEGLVIGAGLSTFALWAMG